MWPYFLFAIVIILLYHYRQPEWMVLVMILFSALRYDTGWDFFSYYDIALSQSRLEEAKLLYSFVWDWLFDLAYKLEAPQLIIAIPAILTYPIFFYALGFLTNKQGVLDGLFVYAFWPFFYLNSLSSIRQCLALSVGLLFMASVIRKKTLRAIIAFGVALLLHPSSIVLCVFPIAAKMKSALNMRQNVLILIVLLVGSALMKVIISAVSTYLGYGVYLDNSDSVGGKISIIYLAIAAHLAISITHLNNTSTTRAKFLSITFIALTLEGLIYLSSLSSVVARLMLYFEILLVRVFHFSLGTYRNSASFKVALNILLVLIFFVYLYWTSRDTSATTATYVPYDSVLSSIF